MTISGDVPAATPSAPRIRLAEAGDAPMLAELATRTFVDTYAADNRPEDVAAFVAKAFGADQQAAEVANPANRYLVAEVEGVPAGYVLLRPDPPPPCVPPGPVLAIARFYVTHAWHGRGIAHALMDAALAAAAPRSASAVWLTVWERNARAMAFYRKHGFRIVGDAPFAMGEDVQNDHVMLREVAP